MTTCTALIIPTDPALPARIETIDAALDTLQGIVEGSIEAVSGDDWHFYLHEEGKIIGLTPNIRAARLVWELTGVLADVYCGNAVFLGERADGEEGDVSAYVIDLAEQLFGIHQPTS